MFDKMLECKKPGEITVRTKEGPHLYTPGIILPKLHSTPTTDTTDEITERKSFDKLHTFRHTPDPYLHHLRDNNGEDQEDSDSMHFGRKENVLSKGKSASSRDITKRSIGTMSEPLQTRNFGNKAQPPDFGKQIQPHSSETKTYSEEKPYYQPPPYLDTNGHHKSGSSSALNGLNKKQSSPSSSESSSSTVQKLRPTASTETDTSLDGMNHSKHPIIQLKPLETRDSEATTSSSIKRTQSEIQKSNSSSPRHSDHHPTTSHRDDYTVEQDENPPSSQKIYRLRPTGKDPYVSNYEPKHSDHRQTPSPKDDYTVGQDEPPPSSQKIYRLRPTAKDPYASNYEPKTPQLNQSISSESNRSIHRHKDIIIKPGKITVTSIPSSKASDDGFNKFTSDNSTPVSPRHPNGQPKISPIRQNHDHVDNNGKITPSPLNHAQQQRTPSRTDSTVLSIATEHIIHQSPNNEFTTPLDTSYVPEPSHDFTSNASSSKHETPRPKNKKMILLPVINSSRTYVFEKQSTTEKNIRQSKLNGNFYLATSPALRSLNSSYQANDSRINRSTNAIDEDDFTGQHLGTQVV